MYNNPARAGLLCYIKYKSKYGSNEIMSAKTFLILGIIIVFITGAVFFFRGNREKPDSISNSPGLIISNSAIYVTEQTPGTRVSVSIVRLEKPGFVVIHEDAADAPGKILGVSSLLPAGETENLPPITLSRATTDEVTIYVMLHFDNGDGQFDAADDRPVLDSVDGAPMMIIITVSKDAAEPGIVNP